MSTMIKVGQEYKSLKTGNVLYIECITPARFMVHSSDGSYSGHSKSLFIECIEAGMYILVTANKVDDIKPSLTEVNDRIVSLMKELNTCVEELERIKKDKVKLMPIGGAS
jgi:hypothetical protein